MEQLIVIPALVMALTELGKKAEAKDLRGVLTILGAGAIGGVVGYFRIEGIDIVYGIIYGFAAAGVVTLRKGAPKAV